jgi:hypothetical protein
MSTSFAGEMLGASLCVDSVAGKAAEQIVAVDCAHGIPPTGTASSFAGVAGCKTMPSVGGTADGDNGDGQMMCEISAPSLGFAPKFGLVECVPKSFSRGASHVARGKCDMAAGATISCVGSEGFAFSLLSSLSGRQSRGLTFSALLS